MNFSTFTAVAELFVTTAVFYVVFCNWSKRPFPVRLAFGVAAFEFLVNMLYMIFRMQQAPTAGLSKSMVALYAVHGSLSLLIFIAYVTLACLAYFDNRKGKFYFREHPIQTGLFIFFWILSVGSGEVLYFLKG